MDANRHVTAAVILSLACLFVSCKKHHHEVVRGIYYWKTIFRPSAYELSRLRQMEVRKIYVRLYDVDADQATGQPAPVAPVQMPEQMDSSFEFVPVVFITQKTLAVLKENTTGRLAKNINDLTSALCSGSHIRPSEIQIDCDWTAGSKGIYFRLLRELKTQEYFKGKTLSCTIRMHQAKYQVSSGIPPVDKGLLMCYSMGDIKKPGARNSILDVSKATDYLGTIGAYPLALDIALPLFQWCVLFRDGQFHGILHEVKPDGVRNSGLFDHKGNDLHTCKADTTWEGYSLKKGDIIRAESASYEALRQVAQFTTKQLPQSRLNVLLFSCDSITLSKYSNHELETVYNSYR